MDLLFTDFFIPSSHCEMRFFFVATCIKKVKTLTFFKNFFSSSDIRNRSRKSIKQKNKKTVALLTALKSIDNGKTPGNDGLTTEFLLYFFETIGGDLLKCLNACFETDSLTVSQKKAVN